MTKVRTSVLRRTPGVHLSTTVGFRLVGLAAVIIAGLAVAGCSGSDKSSSSAAVGGDGLAVKGAAQAPAAAAAGGASTGTGATDTSSTGTSPGSTPASTAGGDRAIVRTASVTVGVRDVDGSADRIAALATQPGERVDGDQRSSSGDARTAQITLRVLPARLDTVITVIDRLGTEISRSEQGQDVTATRADVDARISALSTSITRLQNFLSQSTSVPNLLAVETQLSTRQGELESMQAQQRALADQISLASLTVDVVQKGSPAAALPRDHGPAGFGSAVAGGWHGLVVSWRWLVAGLGYVLPIGGLVVLLGLAAFAGYRRRRGAALVRSDDPSGGPSGVAEESAHAG